MLRLFKNKSFEHVMTYHFKRNRHVILGQLMLSILVLFCIYYTVVSGISDTARGRKIETVAEEQIP